MSVRSAVRAVVVSLLALATVPALVPGVAHATTTVVNCPADDLQTAINNASAGDTLQVTGHCTGTFVIDKSLTLQGDGATVLDGGNVDSTISTHNDEATVNINDLTATGGVNSGIFVDFGTVNLNGVTVSGNTESAGPGFDAFGGGIVNRGILSLVDSAVIGNAVTGAGASGGGISSSGFGLSLLNSTVSGNTLVGGNESEGFGTSGGGIYIESGTASLINSTVSGNSALSVTFAAGGGIYNKGLMTVQNSTIGGNSASGETSAAGGGIFSDGSLGFPSPELTATIVSGNTVTGPTTSGPDCDGLLTSGGYNLIGVGTNCGGLVVTDRVGTAVDPIDPKLDTLQNNGGPTQTMGLLAGSPALNAIPLTGGGACLVGLTTDQRGAPRPQGVGCDIGAVEKGKTTTRVTSSDATSTSGQPVTFTATVCANPPSLPATPTGTVKFRDGGSGPVLASGLSLGAGGGPNCAQATFTTSTLAAGRHKIVGIYSGDGVNSKSRGSVIQRVKP